MALTDNLIAFWPLEETGSEVRSEGHGGNALAPVNDPASATGIGSTGDALALVAANSEYLQTSDNADLSVANIDFTFALWVNVASTTAGTIILKGDGSNITYQLQFLTGPNRFRWRVASGAAHADLTAISTSSTVNVSTWYFIVAWHDATANTLNIQVNNGTAETPVSYSAGSYDDALDFWMGSFAGTAFFDGLIDQAGFWKRTLTTDEKTFLYNGGSGRTYADILAYTPSGDLSRSVTSETLRLSQTLAAYIPGQPLTRSVTSETIRLSQTLAVSGLEVAGNAYYVDDTIGIDAPGHGESPGDPWATISYGVSQLIPGDTLSIRGGTYTENNNRIDSEDYTVPNGTASERITIKAYPGETVTIRPASDEFSVRLAVADAGSHYLTFENLFFDGADSGLDAVVYIAGGSTNIRFVNCDVANCWMNGLVFSDNGATTPTSDCEFIGGRLHDNGRRAEVNTGYGCYNSGAERILFDGVEVDTNNAYGLHLLTGSFGGVTDGTIVRNCNIHDNGWAGGSNFGIAIVDCVEGQIYNNLVWNNNGGVMCYNSANDTLVANNTIYNNNGEGIFIQYTTGPGTRVYNNIIYANNTTFYEESAENDNDSDRQANLTANPIFEDADNGDFRLQESSGARDAGITVAEVETDIDGVSRPQGGVYDIGAYEYVVEGIPPTSELDFDAFTKLGYSINPSGTHTPVGTPRGVLIFIFHDRPDTPTVTYGGVTVPQKVTFDSTIIVTDSFTVYSLGASIPTGPQTVAVSNGPTGGQFVWVYTVTAETDTEYVTSETIDSGSVTNPAASMTLFTRISFVAEAFVSFVNSTGNVSPFTNWTSRNEDGSLGPGFVAGSYSYNVIDAAPVTVGWNQTTAVGYGIAAAISQVTDSYQTTLTDALRITDTVTAVLASALTVLSVSKTETLHVGDVVSPSIGTGLDPALPLTEITEARSGLARSGTTWSNYFTPHVMMSIGSADLSNDIIISSLQVSLALNEEQDTARFTLRPSAAVAANPITVLDEVLIGWDSGMSARLFAGQVARVALRRRPGNQGDPFTEVECVDWSRLFNRILITRTWTNTSVTQIVYDIVNDHVGLDFSTTGVQTGLPGVVSFSAANERAGQLLTRLVAGCGGGGHYITAQKVLRFFGPSGDTSATAPPNPGAITDADGLTQEFSHRTDISQQRTRVYSEGRTQSVMVNVPAGETTIPVSFGWGFPTGVTSTAYVRFSGSVSHVAQYWTASHLLGPPGAYVAVEANPGDTTVTVSTSLTGTQWAETSWAHTETNTFFTYTLAAGTTLTGIPASGHGSIQEPIPVGAAIYAQDQIRMMEPLTVSLLADDSATVQIFEQSDAEVTATAAAEDSDGVHEYLISNADVTSGYGEQLIPLAQADLAAYSSHGGIITCDWVTTDRNAMPGTQQVVNLTGAYALSTTVTITNVELSWIRQDLAPTRRCVGSDVKRPGFVDLLSDIITERNAIYR